MRILCLIFALLCYTNPVVAHEMTPTYPQLRTAYVDGLLTANLSMFNARADVEYYEIGVFSIDWDPIPFATTTKILKVPRGTHKGFDVYIRQKDKDRTVYICTLSKLRTEDSSNAVISSKVCSRVDGELP